MMNTQTSNSTKNNKHSDVKPHKERLNVKLQRECSHLNFKPHKVSDQSSNLQLCPTLTSDLAQKYLQP
jgi:hypothetical protein